MDAAGRPPSSNAHAARSPESSGERDDLLSDYARLIARLAPGEDPAAIEAILHRRHGCLSNVSSVEFAREVKSAVKALRRGDEQAGSAA